MFLLLPFATAVIFSFCSSSYLAKGIPTESTIYSLPVGRFVAGELHDKLVRDVNLEALAIRVMVVSYTNDVIASF